MRKLNLKKNKQPHETDAFGSLNQWIKILFWKWIKSGGFKKVQT